MHWRRFSIADIPLTDAKEFEHWLLARWREKDDLLEEWYNTGRFPGDAASVDESKGISKAGFIETEIRLNSWLEIGQIFVVLATVGLLINVIVKFVGLFMTLG